jgi:hypothetical protein
LEAGIADLLRSLGDPAELADVIALIAQAIQQRLVGRLIDGGGSREDPSIAAAWIPYQRSLVIRINI